MTYQRNFDIDSRAPTQKVLLGGGTLIKLLLFFYAESKSKLRNIKLFKIKRLVKNLIMGPYVNYT